MQDLLDFIFPPRCAGCDRPGVLLCDACREVLPLIDPGTACPRCGAPVPTGGAVSARPEDASVASGCPECRDKPLSFAAARCAALLEPPVSRAVVMLKDSGERRYASVLAELLARAAEGWLLPGDVLVPVPASPAAIRRRGFDHATDIARALGRLAGCDVVRPLRSGASADQRALGRTERFANREGAFRLVEGNGLHGTGVPEQVVLVDDVFTTGATLDAAARVLRASGAVEVRALAVARACDRTSCGRVSDRIHSEVAVDD